MADGDIERWLDRMVVDASDGVWRIQPDPALYDSMRTDAAVFDVLRRVECPAVVITSDVATATDEVVASRRRGVALRLADIVRERPNIAAHCIAGSTHESLLRDHAENVADVLRREWTS